MVPIGSDKGLPNSDSILTSDSIENTENKLSLPKNKLPSQSHGWILVDKPVGITSNRVLSIIKRIFKTKSAGFVGTLDPLASGLLVIAVGEATKTIPYFADNDKSYTFTVQWGQATSTDDREGAVIATSPRVPTEAEVRAILPEFIGNIAQRPPQYAAVWVEGRRAYDLARKGINFLLPERQVVVYNLELVNHRGTQSDFYVRCGRGVYVRSLGRDMAEKLGTRGHIVTLRREHLGPCHVSDAILLDNFIEVTHNRGSQRKDRDSEELQLVTSQAPRDLATEISLLPIGAVLDDIPAVPVTLQQQRALRQGLSIAYPMALHSEIVLCVRELDWMPVGLALVREGTLHPKRNFVLEPPEVDPGSIT